MAKLDIYGVVLADTLLLSYVCMVHVNHGRGSVSTDLHELTSVQEKSLAD